MQKVRWCPPSSWCARAARGYRLMDVGVHHYPRTTGRATVPNPRGAARIPRALAAAQRPGDARRARTAGVIARPATSSLWGTALAAVAVSRLLWLGVFIAVLAIDFPGIPLLTGLHDHLVSWDAISFMSIATHGYPGQLDYRDAFLPGFPLLVRAVMLITRDDVIASWVVNAVAETVALWYLGRLVLGERDRSAANFSVWLIALAPTALFLIAPFSESTFIASAAASLYYARAGQSRKAIIAAALACAFRLHGAGADPRRSPSSNSEEPDGDRGRRCSSSCSPRSHWCSTALYMQIHIGDALALLHADRCLLRVATHPAMDRLCNRPGTPW